MNYSFYKSKLGGAVLAVIMTGLLISSAQAQPFTPFPNPPPSDTVYFDPNDHGNTTSGGSGDFATSDFWNPSTSSDGQFVSGTNGVGTLTFGEEAIFNGPAGTVTVSAPVSPDYLEVGVTSGTETFGTTGANASTITFPQGNANSPGDGANTATIPVISYFNNAINIDAGSENVVFNSGLNFSGFNRYYNVSNTVNSSSTGNVAFNGGITFTNNVSAATSDDPAGQGTGEPNVGLSGVAGTTFTINSAVTQVNTPGATLNTGNEPYVALETNNTMTLTSNASFSGVYVIAASGTILDQGATYSDAASGARQIFVGGTGQYLTDVAGMTVTGGVQFINSGGTLGSALAAETTYSGQVIGYSGAAMNLTSGAGGRVNITGDVVNGNGFGINKVGVGTVNMHNANVNGTESNGNTQTGSWEIQNGTMLLNGTWANNTAITGSQLTIDAVAPGAINANQTYAILGGNGSTNVPIIAAGGSSIIAPGDPTVNGGIGTLNLNNGLEIANGATFDFVLQGSSNSVLDLGNADFAPVGTLTFNLTQLGSQPLQLDTPYGLIDGSGVTDYSGVTNYVFNAPDLYKVSSYGYDDRGGVFYVEFEVAPEPSTYALMLGGLAFLAFCIRRKSAQVK